MPAASRSRIYAVIRWAWRRAPRSTTSARNWPTGPRSASAGHHTATRPWIDYAQNFTKGLQHLTGAQPNEVVAMNSLTINLHLMMASFYRPVGMRDKVLIEAGAFSSDRHAILGQLSWHKLDAEDTLVELEPRAGEELLRIEDIEAKIEELGPELALVLWPGVQYRTGQAFDCARIAAAAHAAGRADRVRPGAFHRQPAAGAARLGRRFRGVVLLQVPERGTRGDRRVFHPRAALREFPGEAFGLVGP